MEVASAKHANTANKYIVTLLFLRGFYPGSIALLDTCAMKSRRNMCPLLLLSFVSLMHANAWAIKLL